MNTQVEQARSMMSQAALMLLVGAHAEGLGMLSRTMGKDLPDVVSQAFLDHVQSTQRLLRTIQACDD